MTYLGPTLRRRKRPDRPGRRVALAILASLLINVIGGWLLLAGGFLDFVLGKGTPAKVSPVALAPLTVDQWNANRALSGSARPALPVTPPPSRAQPRPPEPPRAPGQVVEVAPSQDNRAPDHSKYLSDRNNRVEKETRSRAARAGYANVLPAPSQPGAKAQRPPGEEGHADRSVKGKEGERAERGGGAERLAASEPKPKDRIALAPAPSGEQIAPAPEPKPTPPAGAPGVPRPGEGEGGQRRSGGLDPRLMPTTETLARVAGGPSPDHLDGVEDGQTTALNTREWKYATFMNQVKRAIAVEWEPRVESVVRDRDPDGKIFFYKDRHTLLNVTLDQSGTLKDVGVLRSSQVDFFDQVAMDAVRRAQPFLNPPHGMVDANGEVRFAFGFYFEVGRSGIQIFRAPGR